MHLVAEAATGPFSRAEVFAPQFACAAPPWVRGARARAAEPGRGRRHEPTVTRGPRGEWVMTYAAYNAVTRSMGLRGYTAAELAAAKERYRIWAYLDPHPAGSQRNG